MSHKNYYSLSHLTISTGHQVGKDRSCLTDAECEVQKAIFNLS